LRRMHMSSGGRLNPSVAPSNRLPTGMGPVSQISTQSLGMLGNAAPMSNDFSMQLLHDLGIDPANITNQVFIANVRFCLYGIDSLSCTFVTTLCVNSFCRLTVCIDLS